MARCSGHPLWLAHMDVSKEGKKSWRVRVGPVAKRAEAQKISRALEGAGFSTWVLADDGASGS